LKWDTCTRSCALRIANVADLLERHPRLNMRCTRGGSRWAVALLAKRVTLKKPEQRKWKT
jgi:hypothetical protein